MLSYTNISWIRGDKAMRMSSVRKMAYLTAVLMTAGSFAARADIITTATAPGAGGDGVHLCHDPLSP